MPKRLATTCLAIMFLVGITSPVMRAQDAKPQNASLKDITAVYVLVEDLPDGAKVLGLTKDSIQTDVELKLRLAGMRVATRDEYFKLPGSPSLYVNVNVSDSSARAASIDVELDQNALLERTGALAVGVTTWSASRVIANPSTQFVRESIKDEVDKFMNAWLSVNPKK
jgi:hypothetical protein